MTRGEKFLIDADPCMNGREAGTSTFPAKSEGGGVENKLEGIGWVLVSCPLHFCG